MGALRREKDKDKGALNGGGTPEDGRFPNY
jgi:hypothetical protein